MNDTPIIGLLVVFTVMALAAIGFCTVVNAVWDCIEALINAIRERRRK